MPRSTNQRNVSTIISTSRKHKAEIPIGITIKRKGMKFMQEKDMVNDVLSMVNSSLTGYANAIAQTSNQQLRQLLQQTRDSDEQFQYQLAQVAMQKGYYQPAQPANQQEIQQIRDSFTQRR
jgi:spore coat protein CotF